VILDLYEKKENRVATTTELAENEMDGTNVPEVDSKYRLIILAAKRSKQLQRGAQPRIEIDPQKHKPTRIALEEVIRGRVHFDIKDEQDQVS
jgi:DNA-directed RNA polymerase omega subunit